MLLSLGVVLLICIAAVRPASAETSGISGYSGMDGGKYCSNGGFGCHSTEDITRQPTVRFEGPAHLDPGAIGTYRFVVVSGAPDTQIAAGLDIAAGAGSLIVVDGEQTQLLEGEITHTGPKDNDTSGEAAWQFQWQAPTEPGDYVLFGAGNSVDYFGSAAGDWGAITTILVTVGEVAPTATASAAATPTATTEPTATASPIPCPGDCNGNGAVTVNELVSGVNIALGSAAVDLCRACDGDDNGAVSVNELIAAVRRALDGC
jgi:hypothetical protein